MKKLTAMITVALAASGFLLGANALAVSATLEQSVKTAQTQQKGAEFLFVINSPTGGLKQVAGNHYQLTLPVKGISSVLAFSDRPERIVKHLTLDQYVKAVHSGKDSFAKNPPNIAVTIAGESPIVFVLKDAVKQGDNVVYNLELLNNQQAPNAESGHTSIYIDWSFHGGTFPP
jgi:archaellum component FlaG (FlaF/FlaG flagellin family)